jgi:hypothetical protein
MMNHKPGGMTPPGNESVMTRAHEPGGTTATGNDSVMTRAHEPGGSTATGDGARDHEERSGTGRRRAAMMAR